MKKLTLSIAAIAAMGTFAVAGGDIAPVEPVVETPAVVETSDAGFYLGGAYGYLDADVKISLAGVDSISASESFNEFMLLAGYKVNKYIAVEGRYWFGSADDIDWFGTGNPYNSSIDAWGIYVKPMYPVTDQFDVYALLGYGSASMTVKDPNADYLDDDNSGLSWGLGASYDVNENIGVFVDFVRNFDDTITYNVLNNNIDVDRTFDTWNFGVTYKF